MKTVPNNTINFIMIILLIGALNDEEQGYIYLNLGD